MARTRNQLSAYSWKIICYFVFFLTQIQGNLGDSEDDILMRREDIASHFILRLVYCRTEDLRRWLLLRELDLFKLRWHCLAPAKRKQFLELNNLDYSVVCIIFILKYCMHLHSAMINEEILLPSAFCTILFPFTIQSTLRGVYGLDIFNDPDFYPLKNFVP